MNILSHKSNGHDRYVLYRQNIATQNNNGSRHFNKYLAHSFHFHLLIVWPINILTATPSTKQHLSYQITTTDVKVTDISETEEQRCSDSDSNNIIIVDMWLRVTLKKFASNFESPDWHKHNVSEALFEIVSQFFYSFFRITVVLSSRNKTRI